jgi:hypothetical protein
LKEKTVLSSDDEKFQKNSNPDRILNLGKSMALCQLRVLVTKIPQELFYTTCRKLIFAVVFCF